MGFRQGRSNNTTVMKLVALHSCTAMAMRRLFGSFPASYYPAEARKTYIGQVKAGERKQAVWDYIAPGLLSSPPLEAQSLATLNGEAVQCGLKQSAFQAGRCSSVWRQLEYRCESSLSTWFDVADACLIALTTRQNLIVEANPWSDHTVECFLKGLEHHEKARYRSLVRQAANFSRKETPVIAKLQASCALPYQLATQRVTVMRSLLKRWHPERLSPGMLKADMLPMFTKLVLEDLKSMGKELGPLYESYLHPEEMEPGSLNALIYRYRLEHLLRLEMGSRRRDWMESTIAGARALRPVKE